MAQVVGQLRPEDFEISERDRTVSLTEIGEDHVEQLLGEPLRDLDRPEDITPEQARLLGHLEQALRADHLFKRNKDYVVQGGRVIIVDEFTGRLMAGRRWSDGLHQAVEAKEGVRIRQENVTYATITLQNYFRMYAKLAGMTGTALTEAEEFNKIYSVDVVPLPTNLEYIAMRPETDLVEVEYSENGHNFQYFARPGDESKAPVFWRRKDYPDLVYRTQEAKFRAIATEILRQHVLGQPMLVGTTSVELSELLSKRLTSGPLKRLALALILRDAYLESQGLEEEGMRIEALDPLYQPLDQLTNAVLRPFSRDLAVPLNPSRPDNTARLAKVLDLDQEHVERLGEVLETGIKNNVLNAKKHDEESRIIADAGALGAVTIATNMAGRGVDIKLGGEIAEEVLASVNRVLRRLDLHDPENLNLEERLEALETAEEEAIGIYGAEIELFRKFMQDQHRVREVGGLHVIGSERHESRRIDNQLRGRSARQGDPGSSKFFLSLEDELMRLFGGSQVAGLMERLNIDDAIPIAHGLVDRTIEQAQTRVEGANFDTRKHLLEYDDVLNQQREVFYGQRNRVFSKEELLDDIEEMLRQEVARHISTRLEEEEENWKLLAWLEETQPTLGVDSPQPYPSFMIRLLLDELRGVDEPQALQKAYLDLARDALQAQYDFIAGAIDDQLDRALERLEDQVRQRAELADTAIEGVLIDAEETGRDPDGNELVRAVENVSGLKIQLSEISAKEIAADPERFRGLVPNLVEASLGLRVWMGLVNSVENRIGEGLGLESNLPIPIDWDQAAEMLLEAFTKAWEERSSKALESIRREMASEFGGKSSVSERDRIRALVQMSYGQRTVFDRRTQQRRKVLFARLTYAFSAAELLNEMDEQELADRVLDHLRGAQEALQTSVGEAELLRLGSSRLDELEPAAQRRLRLTLGDEGFDEIVERGPISALSAEEQAHVASTLGQGILTETYRGLILSVSDRLWVDYLTQMEALRTSIGLEAYGQRDPLVQYKSRAFDMFQNLVGEIQADIVSRLFRIQLKPSAAASTPSSEKGAKRKAPAPVAQKAGQRKGKRKRRRRRR